MAKEKFVRSKPHVNVGSWLKQKLGFSGASVEPPYEPLEPEPQQQGTAFNPEEALGASPLKDTDSDGVPEIQDGWRESDHQVDVDPDAADPDKLYRVKVKFPTLSRRAAAPTTW
jgi:hypothetical protein